MRRTRSSRPFRTILCGIDFSKHSRSALRYAAALARSQGATVTVLHAIDPVLNAAAAAAYDMRAIAARTQIELDRFVSSALGSRRTASVIRMTRVGEPVYVLLRTAARLNADVVVLGTHGFTGIKKLFFGSTTEAVLRRSRVPVLAVPRTSGPPSGWPSGPVLAPLDLSTATPAEAASAARVARTCRASLTLLHVIPAMGFPLWMRVNERAVNRSRMNLARERLRTLVKTAGVDAELRVVVGDMSRSVAAVARRARTSMIVLSVPAAGPIGRLREASSAYRLLHEAFCPLLIVHLDRR